MFSRTPLATKPLFVLVSVRNPCRFVLASREIRKPFSSATPPTLLFSNTTVNMASDDDYMSFLNKANEDPNAGQNKKTHTSSASGNGLKAQDNGVEVPQAIQKVIGGGNKVYTSDADEPFVGVALRWNEAGQGLPNEMDFAKLVQHFDPSNADVELLDPIDWDSNGDYGDIIDAVREAGKGNDVRVYKIAREGSRIEYWVVTTQGKGKDAILVGAKALAIES